jgi:hypothetical protein
MTLVTKTMDIMDKLKKDIGKIIKVVDSGEIHWLLGIEIWQDQNNRSIHLSQRSYIDAILARFRFTDIKLLSIPFDPHTCLSKDQCPFTVEEIAFMCNIPYQEAVGSLQYLSVATQPDVTFAVSILSKFYANPGPAHWNGVK